MKVGIKVKQFAKFLFIINNININNNLIMENCMNLQHLKYEQKKF